MPYTVFAEVSIKPEFMAQACDAVDGIVAATRDEEGCEQFEPHRASNGDSAIYIYERWRDRAAFDFHHAQPYTREVYANYENWLAGPVCITELSELSA
jgi:quinol monooxygenase YgiN